MSGLSRNNGEKYYTDQKVAEKSIDIFTKIIEPKIGDLILEPSAGNGAFSNLLFDRFQNVIALDIEPEDEKILKQDFFTFEPKSTQKIHSIGNPPFGRQSSLAKQFIKKASEFSTTISFILPKSFKKASFQKAFPSTFHLEYSEDVPKNSFRLENKVYDVPCVFQIWIKKSFPRDTDKLEKPTYFSFVTKEQPHDFSIRRVGGTAGTIDFETKDKSKQSHYFIKLNYDIETFGGVDSFLESYRNNVKFLEGNTVGPKSISKPELILALNSLYIFF